MNTPQIIIEQKQAHETCSQAGRRLRDKHCNTSTLFSSITHKANWVGLAVSDKPIGLDLELQQERNPALFTWFSDTEWSRLGAKSWTNFYRLWTAKEAVVKKCSVTLEAIKHMQLIEANDQQIVVEYNKQQHTVHVVQTSDYIYAYTV